MIGISDCLILVYGFLSSRRQSYLHIVIFSRMTSSSSESILLLVPHVKLKKNEGELYLMSERLGWMVGNKDSFNVTHKYCDIKSKLSFY